MDLNEMKAELSVVSIQLEHALNIGLPHSELVHLYRRMKELHYQIAMEQIKEMPGASAEMIE